MPIRIRIDINGRDEKTYWIGRISGDTNPDSFNTYVVHPGKPEVAPWDDGTRTQSMNHFTHRYGDGLEICTAKGLTAMGVNA